MTVFAMEVITAVLHPNADTLWRYEMTAPGYDRLQIVANSDRVYHVGDCVAIALVNATLKDGTRVKVAKIRGLRSYGLALGVVEAAIGTDLSAQYCQPELSTAAMRKWPSVELLHNVRRTLEAYGVAPRVTYRAKVKLDGTNGGVQVFPDGRVVAQSRSQVISIKQDNMGFAKWANDQFEAFAAVARDEPLAIYGEWCGKGIQKRTSISWIDRQVFAIFAVRVGHPGAGRWAIAPEEIATLVPAHPDIFVLPFYGDPFELDFSDRAQMEGAIAQLNAIVAEVERVDPWVKATFGIAGLGEGLVLYPVPLELAEPLTYSDLLFKAKGEKHQVVKTKQPVQIDPAKAKSIDEFVELFVTPARLEQAAIASCNSHFDMCHIGAFLKWLAEDVKKESVAELDVAGLVWKDASKAVTNAGKTWFRDRATR